MTREDIIRMAREAGFDDYEQDSMLERFAILVAAAEREECAKVCDRGNPMDKAAMTQTQCASAIRARGEK